MAVLSTARDCPYCGSTIELGDCKIVATNFTGWEHHTTTNRLEAETVELPSRSLVLEITGRSNLPVVADAPNLRTRERPKRKEAILARAFGGSGGSVPELPPLISDGVAYEDVPARACPQCDFPLPQDIDTRRAIVVAVVGINRVGKTHLLAASVTEAWRGRGLGMLGCSEFTPDNRTSQRFMEDYYQPLFRHGNILTMTNPSDRATRFEPLVFKVTLPGFEPFTLLLHDIAGEVVGNYRRRAHEAAYLRAARGVIFVVDPRDIGGIREELPDWILASSPLSFDQGGVLAACLETDGPLRGAEVPLALTIAKADLLPRAQDAHRSFLQPRPTDESHSRFLDRVEKSSAEIEAFLEHQGAFDILEPTRAYAARLRAARRAETDDVAAWRRGRVTYHAVSALGHTPDEHAQQTEKLAHQPQPLNCLDPLATILAQIAGPPPAAL